MSDNALFEVVRAIAGRGLTQGEVDRIKAAIPVAPTVRSDRTVEIDPNDALLVKELERDEGRVLHAYQDSLGFWTIGIGRLIDKRKGGGITNEEADYLKRNDIAKVKSDLDRAAPWWRSADPVRQRAIQNLAFNLGADGLVQKWPNTVALMKAGKWREAAAAIRSNKVWVGQVKGRAERIAQQIETGGQV
ncbi:glycoside hydrolase family protein [Brevundimonas aurantiaca]|uniref:glycoside hydrolase family protein n=1 Tax=Brevundimonas aurantiaca TaxID=74316 RepID=UPI0030196AC3